MTLRLRCVGLIAGLGMLMLVGCGQKGPLYLPDEKPSTVPSQPAQPAQPASPTDSSDDATATKTPKRTP